jgi:hypothetical protein
MSNRNYNPSTARPRTSATQHHHHHHRDGDHYYPHGRGGSGGGRVMTGPQDYAGENVYTTAYFQSLAHGNKFQSQQQFNSNSGSNTSNYNTQPQYDNYADDYSNPYQTDYASFEEEVYGNQQIEQQQPQQKQFSAPVGGPLVPYSPLQDMTDEEFMKPADIKWATVTFEAGRHIAPISMLDEKGQLKNKGNIVFALTNQHLTPISASVKRDFFGLGNAATGVPQPSAQQLAAKNDLVSYLEVSIMSSYKGKMLISFPTVPSIGEELYRNGANHVNYTIPAGVLSEDKPYVFTALNREIPFGSLAYSTNFDSAAPDMMESSITHVQGRGYSLVPFNHPIVLYYNKDHMDKPITEENCLAHLGNDVQMATDDVMHYLEVAKNTVGSKLSLGNITTNFAVLLSAIEPTDFKSTQKREFLGFADTWMLGKNASAQQREAHLKTKHSFDITVKAGYFKLDGRPLEMNTRK